MVLSGEIFLVLLLFLRLSFVVSATLKASLRSIVKYPFPMAWQTGKLLKNAVGKRHL